MTRSGPGVEYPAAQRKGRLIARPGLFALLKEAGRVTVVSAPAGGGKTSLVRSWISEARLTERVAWVSVARGERDPQAFWLTVLGSLRRTAAGSRLVRELTAAPGLDGMSIVARFVGDLGSLAEPLWLVIDDLHELGDGEALEQVELLLESAPAQVRFVLLTRRDLRLGLHRLRLEGDLTEIRGEDLRFTLEESRALLEAAGLPLSDRALASLVGVTEGWAAGLRLAALSMARHPDPEGFAASFSGRERTVAEYLLAEVLERQPVEVTRLLLRTSMLERVSGPLADRLTRGSGSERMLIELEDAGAFVMALDPERSWFRYHHLFADLLALELRRTAPGELLDLHATAAAWFAEHGYPVEAIRHAQAAENWGLAARLLADSWFSLELDGRRATACELLSAFPAGMVADPELAVLAAAAERFGGSLDEAERYLALATRPSSPVPEERRARFQIALTYVRLSLAETRNDLEAVAEEAQRLLTPTRAPEANELGLRKDDLRTFALLELGVAEIWTGRLDEAEEHLERVVADARRIGRPRIEVVALANWPLAGIFRTRAMREERAREAIELARENGWEDDIPAAVAYTVLGAAALWRARLQDAEGWMERAENALRKETHPAPALMLYTLRGVLELARRRPEQAMTYFRDVEHMAGSLVTPHMLALSTQGRLLSTLIRLDKTDQVRQALAKMSEDVRETAEPRVVLAELRLAQNDPEGAAEAVAPIVGGSTPAMPFSEIEAFLVEAIARDALRDAGATSHALERALDLAEPDGLLLPFLLFPAPELLERHSRLRSTHASLISGILNLLSGNTPAEGLEHPEPLQEPLSERELRVLRYLPTNLQVPEIAAELFLSVNTVRTHTRHLYAKLGVHSRNGAVARGRALGLLAPPSRPPSRAGASTVRKKTR